MRRPYSTHPEVTLYAGDAIEVLRELPDSSADCVVTSPPYWGLRDYGTGTWSGGDPACAHSTGRGTHTAQTKNPSGPYPSSAAHRGGHPRTCRRCDAVREDRNTAWKQHRRITSTVCGRCSPNCAAC